MHRDPRTDSLFVFEVVKANVATSPGYPTTVHYRCNGVFMISGSNGNYQPSSSPKIYSISNGCCDGFHTSTVCSIQEASRLLVPRSLLAIPNAFSNCQKPLFTILPTGRSVTRLLLRVSDELFSPKFMRRL